MNSENFPRAFISYAHEDKDVASRLAEQLAQNGVNPWFDAWEIAAGDSLVERVFEQGLKDCAVFVILLSPASVKSSWVRQELDVAVVNRIRRLTKVIPVLTADCDIPVSLRALKRLNISEGMNSVTRAIVDAAYDRRPQRPLVEPEPERIRKLVSAQKGYSTEATTVAASIARSLDLKATANQFYDGRSLQSELDLTPEQINDAIEELESRGLVRVMRELGTGEFSFSFIEPTYALYYEFSQYLREKIDPARDIRQVAASVASHGDISGPTLAQELGYPPKRVNFAVAYLADYGVIRVLRTLGTGPYEFAEATATGATRRFVRYNQ